MKNDFISKLNQAAIDSKNVKTDKVTKSVDEIKEFLGIDRMGYVSDGYHTFDELYHHRAILTMVIVAQNSDICWKSKQHDDGSMFEGMFIVGIDTPMGQATYHYDLPYWDFFKCKELEKAPVFDGHTPEIAINRIASIVLK